MAAASAVGLAEEWLYATLSGDTTLAGLVGSQIYAGEAPESASYPLIVFQLYSSLDADGSGFAYYLTVNQYLVTAADRVGSIAGLDTIARRIFELLHGQANVVLTNGAMLACQRERNITRPGVVAGVATRELAAIYQVVTQEVYP